MRKLILSQFMSVDGFVADKNKTTGFFDADPRIGQYVNADLHAFIQSLGAIILGKSTYEMFASYWPNITTDQEIVANDLNKLPKFVFSNTLHQVHWGNWDNAILVKEDSVAYIRALKAEPGKDLVVWGSIRLAQSLLDAGLIDEIHFFVCPVLLTQGYKLFERENENISLILKSTKAYHQGVVRLIYSSIPITN